MPSAPLPVLVVSPDPLARSGLAAVVAARGELALAGEAGPGEAARVAAARAPAVVLWDAGPGPLPAIAEGTFGGAPVVALVGGDAAAGAALRAGARGVLSRGATPDAIAAALAAAAQGLSVADPALVAAFLRLPEVPGAVEPLTPREREVLALLAEGLANKEIAARLGISDHTAKFHVNAILGKLGVESRAEAIVRAARLGLVLL